MVMETEPRQNNSRITVINKDGTDGPTYVWKNQDCLFGSSPDAHIIIGLDTVAEHHCMLFVCPDERVKAIDVRKETPKATSGTASTPATVATKINGIPVYDYAYLPDRCIVDIGGRLFRFSYSPSSIWSSVTDPRVIAAAKPRDVIAVEQPHTPVTTFASYKFCQLNENGSSPSAKSVISHSEIHRRKIPTPKKAAVLSPVLSPNRILSPSGTRSGAVLSSTYSATRPLSNVNGTTSSTPKLLPRRVLTTKERYGPTPTRQETMGSQSPKTRISRYPSPLTRSSPVSDSPNSRSNTSRRRSSLEHPVGHLTQTPPFSRARSSTVYSCPSRRKQVSFGPQLSPEHFDKTLPPCTPLKRGGKLPTVSSSSKKANVSATSETVSFVTPATHMTTASMMDRTPSRVSKVVSLPPTPDENLLDSREKNVTTSAPTNFSVDSASKPIRLCRANLRTSLPIHFSGGNYIMRSITSRSANTSPRRPLRFSTPRVPPTTPIQPEHDVKRKSRSLSNSPISKVPTAISDKAQNKSAEKLSKIDKSPLTKPTWASIVKAKPGPVVKAKRLQTVSVPSKSLQRVATFKRRSNMFSKGTTPPTPIERYGAASSTGHALSPAPIIIKKRHISIPGKSGTPSRRISSVAHPRILALKRKSIRDLNEGSPNILSRLTKGLRRDSMSEGNVSNQGPAVTSNETQLVTPKTSFSPHPVTERNSTENPQTDNEEQKQNSPPSTIRKNRPCRKSTLSGVKETFHSCNSEEATSQQSKVKKSTISRKSVSPSLVALGDVMKNPEAIESTSVDVAQELLSAVSQDGRELRLSTRSLTRNDEKNPDNSPKKVNVIIGGKVKPQRLKSLSLTGLRKLVRSPKDSDSPDLGGVRELFKTPILKKSPRLSHSVTTISGEGDEVCVSTETQITTHNVINVSSTEKRISYSSSKETSLNEKIPISTKKPFQSSRKEKKSLQLLGLRNLVRIRKSGPSPRISGVRRLLRSPKQSFSPELVGVRELMKSPTTPVSPNLEGVSELIKSPLPASTLQKISTNVNGRSLRAAKNAATTSLDTNSAKRLRRTAGTKLHEESIVSSVVEENILESSSTTCINNRTSDVSSHMDVLSAKQNIVSESVGSPANPPLRSTRMAKRQPAKRVLKRTRVQNVDDSPGLEHEMDVQATDKSISTPTTKASVRRGFQKRKVSPSIDMLEEPPKIQRSTRTNKTIKNMEDSEPIRVATVDISEKSVEMLQSAQLEADNESSKISTPKKRQRARKIEFLESLKEIDPVNSNEEEHVEAKKRKISPLKEDESPRKRGRRNLKEAPLIVLDTSKRTGRRKKFDTVDSDIKVSSSAFSSQEVEPFVSQPLPSINLEAEKSPERSSVASRRGRKPIALQSSETFPSSQEAAIDEGSKKEEPTFKTPLKTRTAKAKNSSFTQGKISTNDVHSTTETVPITKRGRKPVQKEEPQSSPEKTTRVTRNLRKK